MNYFVWLVKHFFAIMSNLSIEDKIKAVLSGLHHFEGALHSSLSHFRFVTSYAKMNKTKVLTMSKHLRLRISNEMEGVDEEARAETLEKLNDLIQHIETNDIGEHEWMKHFSRTPNPSLPANLQELYQQIFSVMYFTDILVEIKKEFGVHHIDMNLMSIIKEHSIPAWVSHYLWLCNQPELDMPNIRSTMYKILWSMVAAQCELDYTQHSVRDSDEHIEKLGQVVRCYKLIENLIKSAL